MNMELGILTTAILIGAGSFAAACGCFYKQRKNRELIEFTYKQIEELGNSLAENKQTLAAAAQRAANNSRRVAWLESRLRQPKLAKSDVLEETILTEPKPTPTLNVSERRRRVLTLASRGQNTETIASTLGMLPGEVELIINLNRANFAQFV